jgi:hypothetical protein
VVSSVTPCLCNDAKNPAGVNRASMDGSLALGQSPTYVTSRGSPYTSLRYRAAATGGATTVTHLDCTACVDWSIRAVTRGHAHAMMTPSRRPASWVRYPSVTSSSPQLGGTTMSKPAAAHARASCAGDVGNAATTASLPTMTAARGPPARCRASVRAASFAGASLCSAFTPPILLTPSANYTPALADAFQVPRRWQRESGAQRRAPLLSIPEC